MTCCSFVDMSCEHSRELEQQQRSQPKSSCYYLMMTTTTMEMMTTSLYLVGCGKKRLQQTSNWKDRALYVLCWDLDLFSFLTIEVCREWKSVKYVK